MTTQKKPTTKLVETDAMLRCSGRDAECHERPHWFSLGALLAAEQLVRELPPPTHSGHIDTLVCVRRDVARATTHSQSLTTAIFGADNINANA